MIKAIIFDCFGVLATDGWLPFKEKYFGHNNELMKEIGDLNKQADSGLLSYDEFIERISSLAGIDVAEAHRQIEGNVPNEQLFEYIKSLKHDYKIGILSNASANWVVRLFTPEQIGLFDEQALSFESGFSKPHPKSYESIAKKLGVDVSECVLIDDQERYCSAARDSNMSAIWYKDTEQCKSDINALLADSKN